MIGSKQPLILCKKCGKRAPADSFVLDHLLKRVVCPDCAKKSKIDKRTITAIAPVHEKKEEASKPAGWDSEDEYLEKVYKQRKAADTNFERIDYDNVRYVCSKCTYKFVYSIPKRYPGVCPNCGTRVITSCL